MTQSQPSKGTVLQAGLTLLAIGVVFLILAVIIKRDWIWTAAITFMAVALGLTLVGWIRSRGDLS